MEPTRVLSGRKVLRVVWLPGSDRLQGNCHCGAVHIADDPVEVWTWLLAHPVGHEAPAADPPPPARPEPALATAGAGS
ncbi:hypothetical protein HC028_19045 [Planosporangium flavigriseum]|uniref:Uncharacterized protein n=1 Tax=Planosporangium flavigriseum TaxID=373681 RepID=A0A8J3LTQ3_9ACTN|nr:hypothetical protein [Planosporangium flavigriseum]NJC66588.1 hypothetical protein [Planosporangium flavigriseum]GIG73461.1 hypothetical protein Pfl04_18650 [Planosporangium flavigriseum]